jgi:CheY-like chemotaxis protein
MARITVVNDYPAFLEMMNAMLGSAGHQVSVLDGQAVAIEDVRDTRPDILIIDVAIKEGGTTGWDVLVLARTDEELRSIPVIVCTADVIQTRERREELDRLGNIRVLEKPFSAAELDALLGPMLAARNLRES